MPRVSILFLTVPVIVAAAAIPAHATECTVQVSASVPRERWSDVAFISRSVAESIARQYIEKLGVHGSLANSFLTVTEGCLVWSIKLHVAADRGLSTVHIDAGDGRLLQFKRAAVRSREWWYE
jgi:hypothetical protein